MDESPSHDVRLYLRTLRAHTANKWCVQIVIIIIWDIFIQTDLWCIKIDVNYIQLQPALLWCFQLLHIVKWSSMHDK